MQVMSIRMLYDEIHLTQCYRVCPCPEHTSHWHVDGCFDCLVRSKVNCFLYRLLVERLTSHTISVGVDSISTSDHLMLLVRKYFSDPYKRFW